MNLVNIAKHLLKDDLTGLLKYKDRNLDPTPVSIKEVDKWSSMVSLKTILDCDRHYWDAVTDRNDVEI